MDFLDPIKQKKHARLLALGYTLIGLALLLGTVILWYRASGYGLDQQGRVIQSGAIFLNSRPEGAQVYYNGILYKHKTNTRLGLPSGSYTIQFKLSGYRSWMRTISIEGGVVGRYTYPLLFPNELTTKVVKHYDKTPLMLTNSPDKRWLIIQTLAPDQFDIYDLSSDQLVPKTVVLPSEILAPGGTIGWQVVDWANDNRHLVLKRTYQKDGQPAAEYILLDRDKPTESKNMSILFGFTPDDLSLKDGNFDQYYLHDKRSSQLFAASIDQPTPRPLLDGVLEYSIVNDQIVYATTKEAPAGQVLFRLKQQSGNDYVLRSAPASDHYLVAAKDFRRTSLVAVGSPAESKVFVYQDPLSELESRSKALPIRTIKLSQPSFIEFSFVGRFVFVESPDRLAVYDAQTDESFNYALPGGLDAPQTHVSWLDDYHLWLVSGGKLGVVDFDGLNFQPLFPANAGFSPVFDNDYHFAYALDGGNNLIRASLLVTKN